MLKIDEYAVCLFQLVFRATKRCMPRLWMLQDDWYQKFLDAVAENYRRIVVPAGNPKDLACMTTRSEYWISIVLTNYELWIMFVNTLTQKHLRRRRYCNYCNSEHITATTWSNIFGVASGPKRSETSEVITNLDIDTWKESDRKSGMAKCGPVFLKKKTNN